MRRTLWLLCALCLALGVSAWAAPPTKPHIRVSSNGPPQYWVFTVSKCETAGYASMSQDGVLIEEAWHWWVTMDYGTGPKRWPIVTTTPEGFVVGASYRFARGAVRPLCSWHFSPYMLELVSSP